MNNSSQRWLLEQLPQWEREGLLTADAARTLRERDAPDASQLGLAQLVMGSLGALLIGAGLIAVIGYNWDDFSLPVRLLFAFLPLLLTQVFSFCVLQRGDAGAAWVRVLNGRAVLADLSLDGKSFREILKQRERKPSGAVR